MKLPEKVAGLISKSREPCKGCEKFTGNPMNYCSYREETGNFDCWRDGEIAKEIIPLISGEIKKIP